jgi:hypothetical protein
MTSQPVRVIAFLLVPVMAVALVLAARLQAPLPDTLYAALGGLCVLFVAVITVVGISRERKAAGRVDERVQLQSDRTSTLFVAGLIDVIALLMASSTTEASLVISGLAILWSVLWIPAWMRHIGVRSSVVIDRDHASVFAFVSDDRHGVQYHPDLLSVQKITDGPIGVGTQFRSRMQLPKGVFEGVEQILEYEPPNRTSSTVVSGLRRNLGTTTFEAVPQGTRVTYRFDSELTYSAALLGQGAMRWLIEADARSRRKDAWARLKRLMESHGEQV